MKTKKQRVDRVLARQYVVDNGMVTQELVAGDNGYHVAVNGTVPDARRRMSEEEAREWYDRAPYKIGERP